MQGSTSPDLCRIKVSKLVAEAGIQDGKGRFNFGEMESSIITILVCRCK